MLPNFLFVHTTLSTLKTILKSITNKSLITFYYDHFSTTEDGKNPPLVVPNSAMDNFIKLTSIDDEHIILIDHVNGKFKKGDQVRIVDGSFKGIEGMVTKITGQKRVIVEKKLVENSGKALKIQKNCCGKLHRFFPQFPQRREKKSFEHL